MARKRSLSRHQWIEAALAVMAERGVVAVAVEPLATRLGVTKGSFYWHFADRDALLAAALAEWERERTDVLIERLDRISDPRERLGEWTRHALGADKALLVRLHAAGDDPVVAPVLGRVTARRVEWLAALLREAGLAPAVARRRARILYGADLGLFQLARALPAPLPDERELRALGREIAAAFLPAI